MPSVAPGPMSPLSSKKRRREDGSDVEVQVKLSSTFQIWHSHLPERTQLSSIEPTADFVVNRHIIPKPRRIPDWGSKRQRIEIPTRHQDHDRDHGTHLSCSVPESATDSKDSRPKVDLRRCHICHRRPTTRSELDVFVSCEECGKRACYICRRECLGLGTAIRLEDEHIHPSGDSERGTYSLVQGNDSRSREDWDVDISGGINYEIENSWAWEAEREWVRKHRAMVCSRCCVERGTDGEVFCFGCLKAEAGS